MRRGFGVVGLLLGLFWVAAAGLEWHGVGMPDPRALPSIVLDAANHCGVIFGGGGYSTNYNDVWELRRDAAGGYAFRKVVTSGTPPPVRSTHVAVCDPVGHRMVVYGGRLGATVYGDVWELDLSDYSWQQLSPSGTAPGPRCLAGAVYSPARRSMVVFGGTNLDVQFNEVWELKLDSLSWQKISPTGIPPPVRESHGAFLDDNRFIVFGGKSSGALVNDMWALDLSPGSEKWTELSQNGSVPGDRATFGADYDPVSRRYYLFSGFFYPPWTVFNDFYVCDMATTTWTQLAQEGDVPAERRSSVALLDPGLDNFVVFGGEGYDGLFNDLHYVNVAYVGVRDWQPAEPDFRSPSLFVPSVSVAPVSVSYSVPKSGSATLRVIDLSGRVVRTLLAGPVAGSGSVTWDGRDDAGNPVPAGGYFCYLQTGQNGLSRKFILTE
jgi:hypothetical protein